MAFERIVGQETQRARLMEAVLRGRLAHAYLFHGPEGTGAEALAVELAKAVNCERGPGEPCQTCRPCRRIAVLQHPDVQTYLPVSSARTARGTEAGDPEEEREDSGNRTDARADRRWALISRLAENPYASLGLTKNDFLSVDDIRALRQEASIKPFEGRRKVALIMAADRMNTPASNALLKTLEEPPGELLLILTTHRPHLLLPTIASRCQPLHLGRLPEQTIKDALIQRFTVDPVKAEQAARQADGSMGLALSLCAAEEGQHRRMAFELLEDIHQESPLALFETVEAIAARHREGPMVEPLLDVLLGLYRDVFLLVVTSDEAMVRHIDRIETLRRIARPMSADQVASDIRTIEAVKQHIVQNAHVQLALTVLALRLRSHAVQAT